MTSNKDSTEVGVALPQPCSAGWWWCCYRGEWRPAKVVTTPEWEGDMKAWLWTPGNEHNWFWVSYITAGKSLPGSVWQKMQEPNVRCAATDPEAARDLGQEEVRGS